MEKIRAVLIIIVVSVAYFLLVRSCISSFSSFSSDQSEAVAEETTPEFLVDIVAEPEPGVSTPADTPDDQMNEEKESEPINEQAKTTGKLMVGIVHTVKDLGIWVKSYYSASDKNKRVALYQNMDKPRHIFILERITSKRIEEKIAAGSVHNFFNVEYQNESTELEKFCIAVYYEMENYDKWKTIFKSDELVKIRKDVGLKVWAYARGYKDPKQIYILFTTSDLEPIYDLIDLDAFKRAYEEAGVLKDPELHYLEQIQAPDSD